MKLKIPTHKWLYMLLSLTMIGCQGPTAVWAADYNFVTEDSRDFYTTTSLDQIIGDHYVTAEGTTIQTGGTVIGKVSYPNITAPTNPSINYPTYTKPGVPTLASIAAQDAQVQAQAGNIGTSSQTHASSTSSSSTDSSAIFDLWLNDTSITYNHFTLPDKVVNADGSIGRLIVDKLNLDVAVYEEESLESMSRGIGHFKSTSCWDGNIGLAGHNRGVNTYFGKLKTLKNGDTLCYETKLGTRRYEVFYSGRINATDFSRLERSDTNMLTLITCVENKPDLRYCVQAREI